jgi:type I restriction enzyme S subunit
VAEMSVPEGFKQTEVGVIRQDWEVTELWQLADFLDGQRKPIKSSDREKMKGIYPYYGASGIIDYVNNYIFDDELILLGEDGENILSRNLRLAFIVRGKVWVNNHAHVLKAKEGCSTEFLAEKLESLNYEQYNSGTAQPKITKGTCAKIKISIPPTKAEQTAIAAALSDMDALIEGVEKLLEKKRRIKQGAMQELLTGKRRVSGFESQAGFQQTEVGAIPKDWKVAKLDSAGLFLKGRNIPKSELKSEGISCVLYGEIYTKYNYIVQVIYSRTSKEVANNAFELKKGDVLFAGSGETAEDIGKCFAYQGNERAVAGGDIVILRPNSDFDSSYLGYILNSSSSITQKYFMGQGSSVFHIYPNSLKKLKIPLPPTLAEQTAIAAILSDMDNEIEQLETQLAKYRQLKTGMMQELLTGKKRLV